MTAADVLAGTRRWSVEQGDAGAWLDSLPAQSIDLLFASPPYEQARLYLEAGQNLGIARDTEEWVAWMVDLTRRALRVTKGLVAWVVEGQTRNFSYSCSPALLMADLKRASITLRKPPAFRRVGIPGSGGPDWLRNDWEWIICCTNGGKLPWSDNTAMGYPPKWAPGGEMSNRLSNGTRVNQWGKTGTEAGVNGVAQQTRAGGRQKARRPSHKMTSKMTATRGSKDGDTINGEYDPPAIANPGNVVQQMYTAEEVAAHLAERGDIADCIVGGGQLGSALASDNEAPFPETLADFFVLSFCPPDGIVADCFAGSGTTLASAVGHGRRAIGCDLRASQVALTQRRLGGVTPPLFTES